MQVHSELSHKKLDVNQAMNFVSSSEENGAVLLFIGKIRASNKNKKNKLYGDTVLNSETVVAMHYETIESLALETLNQIFEEVKQITNNDASIRIFLSHFIGTIEVGEIAVIIAVSTHTRQLSYHISSYLLENLKKRVPIWKKEIYKNGFSWIHDDLKYFFKKN